MTTGPDTDPAAGTAAVPRPRGAAVPGRGARAGRAQTARFALTHTLPAFARGLATARPRVAAALGRLRQSDWSAATLRALRARHGGAPVLVRGLSGDILVLLDPADVRQFFEEPVERLALDAADKVRLLGGLEPTGVICSHGELREARRAVNDRALAPDRADHPSCAEFRAVVAAECAPLTARPQLEFERLVRVLERIGRRIVLGDRAADDEELHRRLRALRAEANWLGMRRSRAAANERLYAAAAAQLEHYAAGAPAHTLVGRALAEPAADGVDPVGQAHHWLLAVDGCAPVVARTLLLLAAHPAEQDAARVSLRGGSDSRLRACVQESLRLWPLVPDLVRVTRAETTWGGVTYPAGTQVLVPIGFHQRDGAHVGAAQLFVPGRWLSAGADRDPRMAPFGHGGGRCPGDRLGLLLSAAVCAEVLRGHRVGAARPVIDPHTCLPGAVDTAGIRLTLTPR
ncbi:cytochrome P450 [Streptomyces bambusae]|uniref:Cytochrome P450 n=1 Tax=Streptomyces bambusae TaxID=1550616 RepID=A0ABS6ZCP7_9ACTN|nr:cytochrome P450 [Streptomyces bambusae]MBW5484506.1 cytochrome P450 [Streptomyces bambusae]